jgi:hypothetical protein
MKEAVWKISSYAGQEFHLMRTVPPKFLIPVVGQFHFLTESTVRRVRNRSAVVPHDELNWKISRPLLPIFRPRCDACPMAHR